MNDAMTIEYLTPLITMSMSYTHRELLPSNLPLKEGTDDKIS